MTDCTSRQYWTPEQALAVYELLHGLCERIMSHYQTQIIDEFGAQHRPSKSQDCSSDPAAED
jgi:hypothetical protein